MDVWSACQYNLGGMLAEAARDIENDNESLARSLRIQSISAFMSSLEAYPETILNPHLARTQIALGNTLLEQAISTNGRLAEVYLMRSMQANEAVSTILEKDKVDWALAQSGIGIAFLIHAETTDDAVAVSDLEKALFYLTAARPGLSAPEENIQLQKVIRAEARAKSMLKELKKATS